MLRRKTFCLLLLIGLIAIAIVGCGKEKSEEVELVGMEVAEKWYNEETEFDQDNLGDQSEMDQTTVDDISQEIEQCTKFKVYICGAILQAGVYEVEEGARVYDVLIQAGGLTDEASQTYLNQAEVVVDGQKIYVPAKEEVASGTVLVPNTTKTENGKVNINTASVDELMTLSGIGEAKAQAIITYRDNNGLFEAIDDIQQISGIKDAVFQTIKDQICV